MIVMIVEDEPLLADCYKTWLASGGYQSVVCTDAQAAFDELETLPCAVILDILLPGANGIQFLQTLQSYADLASIPIIVCSNAADFVLDDLRDYGVRAVLKKSTLTRRDLLTTIGEVL